MSSYSQIISDISHVSYLLQKAQVCYDLSPINTAIGRMTKFCGKDGLIGYSVTYSGAYPFTFRQLIRV